MGKQLIASNILSELGANGEIRRLPRPAPTAAHAAEQLGCPVGAIANSLIFAAEQEAVLILASGAHRVDLRWVGRQHLGGRGLRRADPEFVLQKTGREIGEVSPIGHPAPIETLVDEALLQYERVWAGAGTESALFATTAGELVRITGGRLASVRPSYS